MHVHGGHNTKQRYETNVNVVSILLTKMTKKKKKKLQWAINICHIVTVIVCYHIQFAVYIYVVRFVTNLDPL